MKVIILAGGKGSRLGEETNKIPKPLVTIGDKPILWHLIKQYAYYNHNEFIICCGYKGYLIKSYFKDYYLHNTNITIDLFKNETIYHTPTSETWKISCVDTGEENLTGSRIKQVKDYIEDDENFMISYGDNVSNIDIDKLIEFHKSHGKIATLSAVKIKGKFGSIDIDGDKVKSFEEKKDTYINGGYMVFNRKIFDYLDDDMLEKNTLPLLASIEELLCYKHDDFWACMDNIKERDDLNKLWIDNNAPWKIW